MIRMVVLPRRDSDSAIRKLTVTKQPRKSIVFGKGLVIGWAELVGAQTTRLRRPRSGWHKSTKPGRSRGVEPKEGHSARTGASVNAVRESRGHGSASRPLVTGAPGRLPHSIRLGSPNFING